MRICTTILSLLVAFATLVSAVKVCDHAIKVCKRQTDQSDDTCVWILNQAGVCLDVSPSGGNIKKVPLPPWPGLKAQRRMSIPPHFPTGTPPEYSHYRTSNSQSTSSSGSPSSSSSPPPPTSSSQPTVTVLVHDAPSSTISSQATVTVTLHDASSEASPITSSQAAVTVTMLDAPSETERADQTITIQVDESIPPTAMTTDITDDIHNYDKFIADVSLHKHGLRKHAWTCKHCKKICDETGYNKPECVNILKYAGICWNRYEVNNGGEPDGPRDEGGGGFSKEVFAASGADVFRERSVVGDQEELLQAGKTSNGTDRSSSLYPSQLRRSDSAFTNVTIPAVTTRSPLSEHSGQRTPIEVWEEYKSWREPAVMTQPQWWPSNSKCLKDGCVKSEGRCFKSHCEELVVVNGTSTASLFTAVSEKASFNSTSKVNKSPSTSESRSDSDGATHTSPTTLVTETKLSY